MADAPHVQVKARTETGKGAVRRLRLQNEIPCVLYGRGIENEVLQISISDGNTVTHAHGLVQLDYDGGDTKPVLVRDVQIDHLKDEILHVDFQLVRLDEKISNEIPLILIGDAPGTDHGGLVDQIVHAIEVECLPQDMPDQLELDISNLQLDEVITISEVPMPDKVEAQFLDPDMPVVTCSMPKEEEEEDEEEALLEGEEPELIGREADEEEEVEEETE